MFSQKDAPVHATAMAEGEILYWLEKSSEEGSDFIKAHKGTWRTDPVSRMGGKGLIVEIPR